MSELNEVTKKLGESYANWKKNEKSKDEYKSEFFAAIIEEVKESTLAEKLYVVPDAIDEEAAIAFAEKYNSGWLVDAIRQIDDASWEVILIEDPIFKPFTFVNEEDGNVYTKSVSVGSVQLDDERLKEENLELYEEVTYIPEPERRLKNLSDLPDETLALLQDYVYEGRPVVKLLPPRKAKPEELE